MNIEKEAEAFVGQVHSRLRIKRGYLMRGEDMGYIKSMVMTLIMRYETVAKGQKKTQSLVEACFNTAVGFSISMICNMIVLPWFGFHVSASQAFWIGAIFTVVSIVRGYVLRRFFNRLMVKAQK